PHPPPSSPPRRSSDLRRSTASAHQAPCPAGPSCPLCNTTCTDEARPDARSPRRAGRVENPLPLTRRKHVALHSLADDPRHKRVRSEEHTSELQSRFDL